MYTLSVLVTVLAMPVFIAGNARGESAEGEQCRKLRFSLGAGLLFDAIENDLIETFDSSGFSGTNRLDTYFPYSDRTDWLGHFEVSYRWSRSFRAGVGVQGVPKVEVHGYGGPTILETGPSETIKGTVYCAFLDWLVAPVDQRLWSRWEFSVGGGVSYGNVTVSGDMGSAIVGTSVVYSESWEQSATKLGGQMRTTLDYYLSESVSLGMNGRLYLIPAVDVVERVFQNRLLEAHSIGLTGFSIGLGLGICL